LGGADDAARPNSTPERWAFLAIPSSPTTASRARRFGSFKFAMTGENLPKLVIS